MPDPADILSRLNILGATTVSGGSSSANYLVVLNSSGVIDNSMVSSGVNVTVITSAPPVITGKTGDLAIVTDLSGNTLESYVYTTSWKLLGAVSASDSAFNPGLGPLSAVNAQDAITELTSFAILTAASGNVETAVTFNAKDISSNPLPPFIIGGGSYNLLVPGLNAQLLNGYTSAQLYDLTNAAGGVFTGPIASSLLSGTYNININGSATTLGGNLPAYYTDFANATHSSGWPSWFITEVNTLTNNSLIVNNTTVSASPNTLTHGSNSVITVTVKNSYTNYVSGATVTLSSNNGGDTISAASGPSGSNGVVTFTVSSASAITSIYTATINGNNVANTATVTYT